jgi:hypothetical protein
MLLPNVRMNPEEKRAIVFVSKPASDSPDVNAGFKASCPEQVTKGVGGEPGNSKFFAGTRDKALGFFDE